MPGRHYYRGLDESGEQDLRVTVNMRKLAEQVSELNYGVQRFLSHLVDVRREELAAQIQTYRDRGDHDVALTAERRGDRLCEGIAKLLDEGEY